MRRTLIAVLLAATALGACDRGSSSDDAGSRAQAETTTTTTSPPPVLEFATPDGTRHTFRVVGTRVGLGAGASVTYALTANLTHALGTAPGDVAVFFFDPLLTLTPVRELLPGGATYDVIQQPECVNPVSGELRPECEAAFHPDLLVPVPGPT